MKIQCDCGNEKNIVINNDELHYLIKNQDRNNFSFTHVYNGHAALICKKCGRKLTWF